MSMCSVESFNFYITSTTPKRRGDKLPPAMALVLNTLIIGSVYSNSLNYSKELTFGHEGYLIWQLVPKSGEQK